jgi:NADH-quinone oxidoreductase subunit N
LSIFFFYENAYNSFLKKVNQPLFISNLINIFKLNYIWSISFLVVFFSIGGIPPFGGFFSKLFVFLELAYMNKFVVAFVLIFLSSISVFYYIRIIKIIYFEPSIIDNSNTDFFFIPLTNNTNLFNVIFSILFFFVIIFLFFIDNFFLFLSCYLFI